MQERRTSKLMKYAAGVTALLVLLAGGGLGYNYYLTHSVASRVSLDVNPSVEILINQKEQVLEVVPMNEDAYAVVGNMDFCGSSLDLTINALIGSMLRNGYLSDIANSILVSVDSKDSVAGEKLSQKLSEDINEFFKNNGFGGAVLSQTIEVDSEQQQLADQYGITTGKTYLIQQIVEQNSNYSFEELATRSINELNLLLTPNARENVGTTENANSQSYVGGVEAPKYGVFVTANPPQNNQNSSQSYIGEEKARNAALSHAGLKESDVTFVRCHLDYDDGRAEYEVEFWSGNTEYDYEIDAVSGQILGYDYDAEYYTPSAENNAGSAGVAIDIEGAKATAFAHAGVSASNCYGVKCELDYEHGREIYEISFKSDGYEYDYDIDASSGQIIKHEKEYDD